MHRKILQGLKELKFIQKGLKTEGSFAQNFSYLFSGKVIATILSIAITPILTRLYGTESYGYFAFINAVAMNYSLISALSYDNALVIINDDKRFYNLFLGCIILIITSSFIVLIGLYSLKYIIDTDLFVVSLPVDINTTNINLLVATCAIYALAAIQPKWSIRRKYIKFTSKIGLGNRVVSRASGISIGYFFSGPLTGLVYAELSGKVLVMVLSLYKNMISEWKAFRSSISKGEILKVMSELKAYPKYILSGSYINLLANQIPIYAFTFFFGSSILGNYALANSILNLPMQLLGSALSPLLLEKLNELKGNKVDIDIQRFVKKILYFLVISTFPFFMCLMFFSEYIFPIVFGEKWILAGTFASIISTYLIVQLLEIIIAPIFQVFGKEKSLLHFRAYRLIIFVGAVGLNFYFNNYLYMLISYGVMYFIYGWVKIYYASKVVGCNINKLIFFVSVCTGLCIIVKINYEIFFN